MYAHLTATPGVMKAFGMNLALKPLSHQAAWWDHIPYFGFVLVAVGLQYLQMSQMTKRNAAKGQINTQMQTMQRIMPLMFAYIYFLIPAGVVIYMMVSSGIRILTQDLIFRTGIVDAPSKRALGGSASGGKQTISAKSTRVNSAAEAEPDVEPAAPPVAALTKSAGSKNGAKAKPSPDEEPPARPHPRSKDKRARKAR
jgi:membrane protein insertase Oxa1/YidC/SpoIIIJ